MWPLPPVSTNAKVQPFRCCYLIRRRQIDDPAAPSYGYYFWLDRSRVQQQEVDWAVGFGWGGQRLYIAPALDLVVVVNTGLYKRDDLMGAVPRTILNQYVLKAIEPRP